MNLYRNAVPYPMKSRIGLFTPASPKPGKKIVPDELKTFLKSRLSPFKVPKEYIVMSELPKNPAGKILKRELRKRFTGGKQ